MRLTVPQILMLNHASWVNNKRSEIRFEIEREFKDKKGEGGDKKKKKHAGYKVVDDGGPRPDFKNMKSEEIVKYVMSGENF
jgi:hypothetical protein